jgi:hypothetical protein
MHVLAPRRPLRSRRRRQCPFRCSRRSFEDAPKRFPAARDPARNGAHPSPQPRADYALSLLRPAAISAHLARAARIFGYRTMCSRLSSA